MTTTDAVDERPQPKQDRSRATVEKILGAANLEFAERGSNAVTTTQIAKRAGVSIGALYRFFPDKHAIGLALGDRYLADAVTRFAPHLSAIKRLQDVPDGLRPIIAESAQLALEHAGYYQLTREVSPSDRGSTGVIVRAAMITAFEDLLVGLGATRGAPRLRPAITLVIETVRHTLATCSADEPERSTVVHELTDMIVTYARERLAH